MKKNITLTTLNSMKKTGEKIACLTAYDATFARLLDQHLMDVILVGDSLGMVIQGDDTTLAVTVNDMIYHCKLVSQATERAMVIIDMPFMSYATKAQAIGNASRMIRESGAHMVKLEGGEPMLEIIEELNAQGIAVCGHLGLTPQSVHNLGGYEVQGKTPEQYKQIIMDAENLQTAGAKLLVLECVPSGLAKAVTEIVNIPVIGIGAGAECDGQVLVLHDMLGISSLAPRFTRNFMADNPSIGDAIDGYVDAVKSKSFPAKEHYLDD